MDITSEDFVNKNLYEFCHAEDLQKLHKAHVDCKSRKYINHDHKSLFVCCTNIDIKLYLSSISSLTTYTPLYFLLYAKLLLY